MVSHVLEVWPFLMMCLIYGMFNVRQFKGLFGINILFSLFRIYELSIKQLDVPDFVDQLMPEWTIFDRQVYMIMYRAAFCAIYSTWMCLYSEKVKADMSGVKPA